jgi:pimeloyl-ACP methyl ester carboxylesterase
MMTSTSFALPQPPSLALFGAEPFRAAIEFVSHKVGAMAAANAPGDGHPVVLFPGLAADGTSMAPLRRYCSELGYTALDWGRGFNTGPRGDIDAWLDGLTEHTAKLLSPYDQPATLIGWSLGGLYAREIAKRMAPQVRQVITIGTPFNAKENTTRVGWLFRLLSGNDARIDDLLYQRLKTPPPVPTTSIYSRTHGIVAWQTCRHEHQGRWVQDIEIDGSHIGMGWNRKVLSVVEDRLRTRPQKWRRYVAASAR